MQITAKDVKKINDLKSKLKMNEKLLKMIIATKFEVNSLLYLTVGQVKELISYLQRRLLFKKNAEFFNGFKRILKTV